MGDFGAIFEMLLLIYRKLLWAFRCNYNRKHIGRHRKKLSDSIEKLVKSISENSFSECLGSLPILQKSQSCPCCVGIEMLV